jgi:hypothetical protein
VNQVIAAANKDKPGPHRWAKGNPKTHGRQKGSGNKVPTLLKECILLAAELEGSDTKGKDKLVGYLRMVARNDLRSFVMLLGRIIPLQVQFKGDVRVGVTYRSLDEIRRELANRGITMEVVQRITHSLPR